MFNIIENIKNELYSNNKLNFHVILFILSEPVALSAAYFMIMREYIVGINQILF